MTIYDSPQEYRNTKDGIPDNNTGGAVSAGILGEVVDHLED